MNIDKYNDKNGNNITVYKTSITHNHIVNNNLNANGALLQQMALFHHFMKKNNEEQLLIKANEEKKLIGDSKELNKKYIQINSKQIEINNISIYDENNNNSIVENCDGIVIHMENNKILKIVIGKNFIDDTKDLYDDINDKLVLCKKYLKTKFDFVKGKNVGIYIEDKIIKTINIK